MGPRLTLPGPRVSGRQGRGEGFGPERQAPGAGRAAGPPARRARLLQLPPSPPGSPGGPFSLPQSLPSPSGLGLRAGLGLGSAAGPAAPTSAAIRSLWSAGDAPQAPRGTILSALTAPGRSGAHRLNPASLAAPVAAAAAAATEAALAAAGTAVTAGGPVLRALEGPADPEGAFPDPEGFLDPDPPSTAGVAGSRFVWAPRRAAEPESAAIAPEVARTALLPSSVAVRL